MHSEPRIVQFRGQWCLYWREDGKARRRIIADASGQPVATRQDAERVALDTQRLALKPVGNLIENLADKYFQDKKGKIASYDNMEFAWKAIKPYAGHLRPEHITREWCHAYIEQERRKPKRSDGTLRKHLTVLSAICRWTDKNTPAVVEMPALPEPRDRYLTRKEARKLIAAATGKMYQPHIRLFIILALATAARAAAILEMKWSQIDFKRGMIDLGKGHGNKGRAKVPMTALVRESLEAAQKVALTDFVIEYGGKQVGSIKKGFFLATQRAKLKGVHPHVCRHTAAVWMAEDGRPMSEIAQVLGHTSESVTFRTYARYSPEHLRETISALELDLTEDDSEETDDES